MDRRKWEWTPSILRQARTISSREPLVNIDEKFFEAQLRHRMCHMGFTAHLNKVGDPRIDIAEWDDGAIDIRRINVGPSYGDIPDYRDIVTFFPGGNYGPEDQYVMQLKVGAAPYPKKQTWAEQYHSADSNSKIRNNLQELAADDSDVDAFAFCSDELFYLHASVGDWQRKGTTGSGSNSLGVTGNYGDVDGDHSEGLFPPYNELIRQPGRIVHFTGLWTDPIDETQAPTTFHGVAAAIRVTGLKACTLQDLRYRRQHLYAVEHQHDTDDNGAPKYSCAQCEDLDAQGRGQALSSVHTHWSREHGSKYHLDEYLTRGNIYRIIVILGTEPGNCPACFPLEEE